MDSHENERKPFTCVPRYQTSDVCQRVVQSRGKRSLCGGALCIHCCIVLIRRAGQQRVKQLRLISHRLVVIFTSTGTLIDGNKRSQKLLVACVFFIVAFDPEGAVTYCEFTPSLASR